MCENALYPIVKSVCPNWEGVGWLFSIKLTGTDYTLGDYSGACMYSCADAVFVDARCTLAYTFMHTNSHCTSESLIGHYAYLDWSFDNDFSLRGRGFINNKKFTRNNEGTEGFSSIIEFYPLMLLACKHNCCPMLITCNVYTSSKWCFNASYIHVRYSVSSYTLIGSFFLLWCTIENFIHRWYRKKWKKHHGSCNR